MSTFVIDRMVKYPLVKNVHRHQIGVINNDGDFEPKIFFNFSFTHYVHCSEKKIQVSFLIQFIYYVKQLGKTILHKFRKFKKYLAKLLDQIG